MMRIVMSKQRDAAAFIEERAIPTERDSGDDRADERLANLSSIFSRFTVRFESATRDT